jgi:hypothetical protein
MTRRLREDSSNRMTQKVTESPSSSHAEAGSHNNFVAPNGSLLFPTVLFLSSLPLAWTGRRFWFLAVLLACLVAALWNGTDEGQVEQGLEEKLQIRFNSKSAEDILYELQQWEIQAKEGIGNKQEDITVVLAGLEALAMKYVRQSSRNSSLDNADAARSCLEGLALVCQEASYIGFRCFSASDAVVVASLSLLALVAKMPVVRERMSEEGLVDLPIQCMRGALVRAKATEDSSSKDNKLEVREQQSAELQRKACLVLGALADGGDAAMSLAVAKAGGIQAILQALDWYRFHSEVANWALWAIFVLCSEDSNSNMNCSIQNKALVVQCHGVPMVITAIENCIDTLEVVRHGFAVLFDLMRDGNVTTSSASPRLDVWLIRNSALREGIHQIVVQGMEFFSDAMDIIMMGQAILVGTDYDGEIPLYHPVGQ